MISQEKNVREALKSRSTCRKFSSTAVEQEKISLLVDAALQSPTAMNAQELRFRFVKGKEKIKRLGRIFEKYYLTHGDEGYAKRLSDRGGEYFYGAGLLVLMSAPKNAYTLSKEEATQKNLALLDESQEKNVQKIFNDNYLLQDAPEQSNFSLSCKRVFPSKEQLEKDTRRSAMYLPSYAKIDAGIAAQSLALAAESLGLSSCILGSPLLAFQETWEEQKNLQELLFLKDEEEVLLLLALGYPEEETKKLPHQTERTQVFFIE